MRQKLGQHFLEDDSVTEKIISTLSLGGETIIEIGSGRGALTIPLASALKEKNGKLIAIEKDPELAQEARKWNLENLEIIEGDVLEILPSLSSKLKTISYELVGNIPYYLTGFLLRTVGELAHKPMLTVFTVQKEVAERIVAMPPKMNKLAASVQFWSDPKIISIVSRKSFNPPPEVDSAIIMLKTKKSPSSSHVIPANAGIHMAYGALDPMVKPEDDGKKTRNNLGQKKYYKTVHALFAQPRKTILNNLCSTSKLKRQDAALEISSALAKLGINPKDRPQNLSIDNIVSIAESLIA